MLKNTTLLYLAKTKEGVDYLQKALAASKPVIVGVECKDILNQDLSSKIQHTILL